VKIDFDAIDQRIVALPIDRMNYFALYGGAEGVLFLTTAPVAFSDEDYIEFDGDNPPPSDVLRFDLKSRKTEKFLEHVDLGRAAHGGTETFRVSADGTKVLYRQHRQW